MGHGDEEEGHAAQDEDGEGGAGAREGPWVVVLDPDGLVAVDHPPDRLTHDFHRDDDAQACGQDNRDFIAALRSSGQLSLLSSSVFSADFYSPHLETYLYLTLLSYFYRLLRGTKDVKSEQAHTSKVYFFFLNFTPSKKS